MSRLTPVVKWLLLANAAIFILDYLILPLAPVLQVDMFHPPPCDFGTFRDPVGVV